MEGTYVSYKSNVVVFVGLWCFVLGNLLFLVDTPICHVSGTNYPATLTDIVLHEVISNQYGVKILLHIWGTRTKLDNGIKSAPQIEIDLRQPFQFRLID